MKKFLALKKAVVRFAAVFAVSFFLFSTPVYAAEIEFPAIPPVSSWFGVQPYSDILGWRYKTVGGRLYRRLYNYTRGCWESEYWIECV